MKPPSMAELSARMLEIRRRLTDAYDACDCNAHDPTVTSLSQEFDRLCNDWIRLQRFEALSEKGD